MIRYRRNRAGIGEFPVPLTLIDLAWLVTIVTLCAAKFGIGSVRLPELRPVDKSIEAPLAPLAPKGIEVGIGTDGELRLQGQPIVIDELGARVNALGDPGRPLMISIDTKADGTGHTDRLVQLVDHLQRARIENPLCIRAKSQPDEAVSNAVQ